MARDTAKGDPVLIVDDDVQDRRTVSDLLGHAGYATRQAATGEEALETLRRERPRLVMLEVDLPGLSGYEVCRELRDAFGEGLPIIFMSGERTDPLDRVAGLHIGADDYLVKPFLPDELLARVRRLLRRSATRPTEGIPLTKREQEVLRLVAKGLAPAAIGKLLVISPKTVGSHIEHIFAKLGVHNRAQAVATAFEQGLFTPA